MEPKIPIYKQRGQVLVIRDRWWWYRIITVSVIVFVGFVFDTLLNYDLSIHGVHYFGDPFARVVVPIIGVLSVIALAIIETMRVFSKKAK